MGATSVVIDQMTSAVARLSDGKIEISSACEPGTIGPDTAPCRTRNRMREFRLQAMPQRNEATVKAATAATKVRTTPKRPMNQPVSGTAMPFATANEVMTHVPWSVEAPRLPAMVGSETLAMVVSSTCMNVPSASAIAVIASWLPCSGAGAAWPGALMRLRPVLAQDALDKRLGFGAAIGAGVAAHFVTGGRGDHGAGGVGDIDLHVHRETDAERMIAQLLRI